MIHAQTRSTAGPRPGDPIPDSVQTGYPLLQRHGSRLRRHGVEFHDLTLIFESFDGPVYVDFCHFGKPPNDLMARTIGRKIARGTAQNPP